MKIIPDIYISCKIWILLLLISSAKAEDHIKKIEMTSKVVVEIKDFPVSKEKIEITLEHPRIYLGEGYASGYSYRGVQYPKSYTESFDGLFVMVDSNRIIINDKRFSIEKLPKTIWISGDFKTIKVDDKICNFKKILITDSVIDKDFFDKTSLDNGFTLEFKGGLSSGSSGISIDDNHYILDRYGVMVKVWGNSMYVWDVYYGKISELADKNKTIRIDLENLLK